MVYVKMPPAELVLRKVEVPTETTVVLEVETAREAFVPVSEPVGDVDEDADEVAVEIDVVLISVIIVGEFSAFEVPEEMTDCVD